MMMNVRMDTTISVGIIPNNRRAIYVNMGVDPGW